MSSNSDSEDFVSSRIGRFQRLLKQPSSSPEGALESVGEGGGCPPPPLSPDDADDATERSREELRRIVKEYLDNSQESQAIAEQIAAEGGQALDAFARDPEEAVRKPEFAAALETIIRIDGSRPTFLVRNDRVDKKSSPLGTWKDSLDTDGLHLETAVRCVGRIDAGSKHVGTGFLVAPNLVLTNRHVLQFLGRQNSDGEWKLPEDATIDFGREFRAQTSVAPRKLKCVVYVGPREIDVAALTADHTRLDLAAIELEPSDEIPSKFLSVDASPDWADAGDVAIYTVGYAGRPPANHFAATLLEQLFQSLYGYKRLAPGFAAPSKSDGAPGWTVAHDATTLGGNSGSVVLVAGRSVIAAGLHYGGTRKEPAENWGHVLGLALDTSGEPLKKNGQPPVLREVLDRFEAVLSDRHVSPD